MAATPSSHPVAPRPASPPRWALTIVVWALAYPALTALTFAVSPLAEGWPLPLRTLVISALFVPLMINVIVPLAVRIIRWVGLPKRGG